MDSINVRVAKRLLEIKAVFLRPQEPFTWASGIKSPIYCDNRLILTAPEARNEVEQAIADTVKREYPEPHRRPSGQGREGRGRGGSDLHRRQRAGDRGGPAGSGR